MNKESILYGVIGLLSGALIAGFSAAYAVNNNNQGMMGSMGIHRTTTNQTNMDNNDMSMSQMNGVLKNKTGDEFDKAFLTEMISHHNGAIEMANLAKQNAKHDEIKKLANDIVSAQTNEISKMQSWQSQWGYNSSSNDHNMNDMMSH